MAREDRWALADEDLAPFRVLLHRLLRKSTAETALLTDTAGNLITSVGRRPDLDFQSFLALCAGDYAASREMALMLGEEHFRALYHQSERHQIYITAIADGVLLVLLFTQQSTLGLVRWAVKKYADDLHAALDVARETMRTRSEQYVYSSGAQEAQDEGVDDALDAFFDA